MAKSATTETFEEIDQEYADAVERTQLRPAVNVSRALMDNPFPETAIAHD